MFVTSPPCSRLSCTHFLSPLPLPPHHDFILFYFPCSVFDLCRCSLFLSTTHWLQTSRRSTAEPENRKCLGFSPVFHGGGRKHPFHLPFHSLWYSSSFSFVHLTVFFSVFSCFFLSWVVGFFPLTITISSWLATFSRRRKHRGFRTVRPSTVSYSHVYCCRFAYRFPRHSGISGAR